MRLQDVPQSSSATHVIGVSEDGYKGICRVDIGDIMAGSGVSEAELMAAIGDYNSGVIEANYYTIGDVNEILQGYVSNEDMDSALAGYVMANQGTHNITYGSEGYMYLQSANNRGAGMMLSGLDMGAGMGSAYLWGYTQAGSYEPWAQWLPSDIGGGHCMIMPNNAQQRALANAWDTYASSEAYKAGIEAVSSAIGAIRKLRGVTYYDKRTQSSDTGVIYEDLERLGLPGLCGPDAQGHPGYINMTKLIPVLIEAVKSIADRLDSIEGVSREEVL